jgi:glycine cleavage system aminomethyltransferase T
VVTGGISGNVDRKWFADNLPDGADAQVVDQTSAFTTVGLWGPRARDVLGALTDDDISHEGFGFGTCRTIEVGTLGVLASRISYVGELGWELYTPMECGARLWQLVLEAGKPHGAVPVGIGVYGTTGRLEKGYRAHGAELDTEHTIVEAGMQRPTVKDADFIGRKAYLHQRDEQPAAILCSLTVEDHTSSGGIKRYMLGGEPILTPDGGAITDARGRRSYVTSAGSAPSLGKHVLMSYLPPQLAVEGGELAVEYLGERYPVRVAVAGSTPLFDPKNERIRG